MSRDPREPARLRGHHLICAQFLHGDGYSEAFAQNMLLVRLQITEQGVIVSKGQDDVCAGCPFAEDSVVCMTCSEFGESVADLDAYSRGLLKVEVGDKISGEELDLKTRAILQEWQRSVCASCAWKNACASAINILKSL